MAALFWKLFGKRFMNMGADRKHPALRIVDASQTR
jgi:hypothetical protein